MTKKAIVTHALALAIGAAMLLVTPMPAAAQHDHAAPNGLVRTVRHITEQYKDVAIAKSAGYALAFGCVSGPETGAMGLHFVNMPLVTDGEIDVSRPEIIQQFEAPNRFGLPRFYTLHVWAWKSNPTGSFVNWHANISCDAFTGQQQ